MILATSPVIYLLAWLSWCLPILSLDPSGWNNIMMNTSYPTNGVHPFTPRDLVSLKRVSSPAISPTGQYAVYAVYQYNPDNNSFTRHLELLNLHTGGVSDFTGASVQPGISDSNPTWITDDIVLFTSNRPVENDVSLDLLYYKHITASPSEPPICLAKFMVSVGNVKVHAPSNLVAFTANIYPDGNDLFIKSHSQEQEKQKYSSGVVYDELFVRHWDEWITPSKQSKLFVAEFRVNHGAVELVGYPRNLLQNTTLETPVPPHGDESHYSFSPDGKEIAFASRVPEKSAAWNTNLNIFIVPTDGSESPQAVSDDNTGTDCTPSYSPDGKYLAWLRMNTPGYEADINRIMLLERAVDGDLLSLTDEWDRSPESLLWSPDSRYLYAAAQEYGYQKIFQIKVSNGHAAEIVKSGSSKDISYLPGSQRVGSKRDIDALLFLKSSSTMPSEIFTVDLISKHEVEPEQKTRLNYDYLLKTLMSAPESFWFLGYNKEPVMGWFYKPAIFNKKGRYPLAFLIHGGPESAWNDDFSFRWNPQIYAAAGYAVVTINFHGSTGYGDAFTRSIIKNWGGAPFEDLMTGLDFILSKYSFIDENRVCALGASYGGYMVNWLNGHTERFSCIVNHDGIFDTFADYYATDELWFPEFEMGGTPFEDSAKKEYRKWNPARFVDRWNTPTLVVHGEKDYRLPITEGLSTFTALQRQGVPSRLLYFPDENHWVLKPANVLKWFQEILSWINEWTSDDVYASERKRMWNEKRKERVALQQKKEALVRQNAFQPFTKHETLQENQERETEL